LAQTLVCELLQTEHRLKSVPLKNAATLSQNDQALITGKGTHASGVQLSGQSTLEACAPIMAQLKLVL